MSEKKRMEAPELEILRFDASDVIATSESMTGNGEDSVTGYLTAVCFKGFETPKQ